MWRILSDFHISCVSCVGFTTSCRSYWVIVYFSNSSWTSSKWTLLSLFPLKRENISQKKNFWRTNTSRDDYRNICLLWISNKEMFIWFRCELSFKNDILRCFSAHTFHGIPLCVNTSIYKLIEWGYDKINMHIANQHILLIYIFIFKVQTINLKLDLYMRMYLETKILDTSDLNNLCFVVICTHRT